MTTYQHTLSLDDGEYIAITEALKLMIEHCTAELEAGQRAPYWAHRQSCFNVLGKLRAATPRMTSTNNFNSE